jgi:hypothetical protein
VGPSGQRQCPDVRMRVKSPPDRPLSKDAALASPHAHSSRPCHHPCPRRADSRSMPRRHSDRVGPKSPSPPFGKPCCRAIRRQLRASPRAPALAPRSEASPSAKPPRCPRPLPCPRPDSRVHRFLPVPLPRLSVLAVPATLPASAVTAEDLLVYVLLYNIYFMYMIAHLCIGVGWNLVALCLLSLQRYLVYPTMV